ncbi:hypothetical protein OTU49_009017, partial [Cherax quadricarinatus]
KMLTSLRIIYTICLLVASVGFNLWLGWKVTVLEEQLKANMTRNVTFLRWVFSWVPLVKGWFKPPEILVHHPEVLDSVWFSSFCFKNLHRFAILNGLLGRPEPRLLCVLGLAFDTLLFVQLIFNEIIFVYQVVQIFDFLTKILEWVSLPRTVN